MPITVVVTDIGRAAIINAANTGTLPVTVAQVGISPTAIVPGTGDTTLAGEIKRLSTIAGEVVAADTIHVTALDQSNDAYTLRSLALYLADGTLFAIAGQTDPILSKAAASIAALAVDVVLADIAAASISFGDASFSNPPATTERQGVVELATTAEALLGIDTLRALTPQGAKAAILGWLLTQDGSGSGLDADLLDGQDGAYYANIAARLGFTPVNKAGDTMTGLLTLSGPPTADLHAATRKFVIDQVTGGALGFNPVNRAGDTMTGQLGLVGDPTAAGHAARKAYVDAQVAGASETAASILAKLLTVDGSGSGLDADLLDGLNSTKFLRIIDASIGGNGYLRLRHELMADDLFVQWCKVNCTTAGGSAFSWPIAFPNAVFVAVAGSSPGLSFVGSQSPYLYNVTTGGGTAFGSNGGSVPTVTNIIAIGN